MYKVGQKVRINIHELAYGHESIDEQLQGEIAVVSESDNWIFPYSLKFEKEELNVLMMNYPRRFNDLELELMS